MSDRSLVERRDRVTVIGGGVIGLSIARELAGRGISVSIIDARRCGSGSTSAALGVLSAPTARRSALADLARLGYELHEPLSCELRAETGVAVGHRECGSISLHDDVPRRAAAIERAWKAAGVGATWIDRQGIEDWIPGYGGRWNAALFLDRETIVCPRALAEALRVSCRRRGVEIHEDAGEQEIVLSAGGRAAPRRPPRGLGGGDGILVLAGGAWSARAAAALPEPRPLVEPVRGQALEVRRPPPRGVVRFRPPLAAKEYFIVPRPGGSVWVGATVEEAGFDGRTTEGGREEILGSLRAVYPDAGDGDVAEHWAGLRPRAGRRGGPYLGPWPGTANLWLACGHYRSGILLAPASARILAEAMCDGRPLPPELALPGAAAAAKRDAI